VTMTVTAGDGRIPAPMRGAARGVLVWWRFRWRFSGAELRSAVETLVDLNAVRWTLPLSSRLKARDRTRLECD
jgi:hypothetical protein